MTPQRSDSEQPRTAAGLKLRDELQDIHRAGYIGGTTWERIEPAILAIEAEAGAASPAAGLDVEALARAWEEVANAHNGSGEDGEPCEWCRVRAVQTVEVLALTASAAEQERP